MPRISIVMPSYNHERYVVGAIRSILDQSFSDFELIIVDDGSKDGSVALIESIDDPRIRFFRFERNQGAYTAVNFAMAKTTGDYVCHLNSDDLYLPGKLAMQLDYMDRHADVGALFTACEIIDDDGQLRPDDPMAKTFAVVNHPDRHAWLRYLFFTNSLCHPTVMMRRSVLEKSGFYDERYRQMADLDLWVRMAQHGDVRVLETPTVQFRIHAYNTGAHTPDAVYRSSMERYFILERYLGIDNVDELAKVFPDIAGFAPQPAPGTAAYLLARRAIIHGRRPFVMFGIETLSRLMRDPEMQKRLQDAYGFDWPDFHRITGEHDYLTDIKGSRMILTLTDLEDGSRAPEVIEKVLGKTSAAIELRVQPRRVPRRVRVEIELQGEALVCALRTVQFGDAGGKAAPAAAIRTNAAWQAIHNNDIVYFFIAMPAQLSFEMENTGDALFFEMRGEIMARGETAISAFVNRIFKPMLAQPAAL